MCGTPIHRRGQAGASRLRTLVWVGIFAAAIYVGIKVVPVLVSEYVFQDAMQTTARLATVNHSTIDTIRDAMLEEAAKEDIPIGADDIHVTSDPGKITISVDYSITVDLGLYQWTLNFHPSATNSALL